MTVFVKSRTAPQPRPQPPEVITRHYPTGNLATRDTFPPQPKSVPAGVPARILERRPDLIAAARRFAESFHRAKEARTARLPRFSLSASSGIGSAELTGVGSIGAVNWSLAAGVIQPIFLGGELKAADDIRNAEQKAAIHTYTATALGAFAEVEDALSNEFYRKRREGDLTEKDTQSANVARLGRMQFDQGQTDMFIILRLVGENLSAKVHLALGGDFKGTGLPSK